MAERGGMLFGEGPTACPFVALESDRDRRFDEPDHRHRCYAEPEPAPRALAHQRAYCLSPAFPGCPIFQDWAVRAAARPVEDGPSDAAPGGPQQLGAFDGPPAAQAEVPPAGAVPSAEVDARRPTDEAPAEIERLPSLPVEGTGDAARDAELDAERERRMLAERERRAEEDRRRRADEERRERERQAALTAAVPPFLAGRTDSAASGDRSPPEGGPPPPPRTPQTPVSRSEGRRSSREEWANRREAVVPVWEREPIHGYERPRISFAGSDWLSRLTMLLAVLTVLALVAFAVVMLPSLLGGGGPGATASAPAAGASPTDGPVETPAATPSPTEEPAATPQAYTVAAGDTLFGIAQRFGITVDQLLAANPQITNADLVTIGQVIFIPDPDTAPPGSPAATP